MKSPVRALLFLSFAILTNGCVSVRSFGSAATLPVSDRVRLNESTVTGVYVVEIDGIRRGLGSVRTYELSPGTHTLKVAVLAYYGPPASLFGGTLMTYRFDAGKSYSIKSKIDLATETFRVWIVDDITQQELPVAAL